MSQPRDFLSAHAFIHSWPFPSAPTPTCSQCLSCDPVRRLQDLAAGELCPTRSLIAAARPSLAPRCPREGNVTMPFDGLSAAWPPSPNLGGFGTLPRIDGFGRRPTSFEEQFSKTDIAALGARGVAPEVAGSTPFLSHLADRRRVARSTAPDTAMPRPSRRLHAVPRPSRRNRLRPVRRGCLHSRSS
jgi:hypothetical protein